MSNPNLWAGQAQLSQILSPQAITGATSTSSIDTTDYFGSAIFEINSAAGTSDSLTTNGTFAADTDWTKGTGWTIAAGVATCSGAQTGNSDLKQNQALTAGVVYTLTYTIANHTAGILTPLLGGTAGTPRSADGTYTETIICGSGADPKLVLRGDLDFAGNIDNVSVIAAILAVKIQHSPDDSTWADVTGAALSAAAGSTPTIDEKLYGIAGLRRIIVNIDACDQYVKAVLTPGGASASFTPAVSFCGIKPNAG